MYQVKRWDIITVGHVARNYYWGEEGDEKRRSTLCTSSVVITDGGVLLIDPSQKKEQFAETLYNNCGLRPDDIDMVYVTHFHPDHWEGVDLFEKAEWYMPKPELDFLIGTKYFDMNILSKFKSVQGGDKLMDDTFEVVPLPGHTAGLCGLLFEGPEGRILASGDCVMTKEYYHAGRSYAYCDDPATCEVSMRKIKNLADVVIPGHGNYFSIHTYPLQDEAR